MPFTTSRVASQALRLQSQKSLMRHTTPRPSSSRLFSTTQTQRSAGSHGDHYDPPTGWLWGRDPSKQYPKESWENLWTYGYFGCMAVLVIGYIYKPDTSIQTWALEEARRRLEAEGFFPDPEKK